MGCTSSSPSTATPGSRPSRTVITTTVPVQRSGMVSRPLVATRNFRHGAQITQRELHNMRETFWSTRTEGSPQMWQNIRSAAEASAAGDLMLANAILEASNIVTPTGTMDTLYDERGAQYKVPMYCYANPIELVGEGSNAGHQSVESAGSLSPSIPTAVQVPGSGHGSGSGNTPTASPVRAVSASRVQEGKTLNLKIRVNPGDINLAVKAYASYSILDLKQTILEQAQQAPTPLPEMKEDRQRIFFMGRELQNTQRLAEVGFDEQKVVQVFLRQNK